LVKIKELENQKQEMSIVIQEYEKTIAEKDQYALTIAEQQNGQIDQQAKIELN
jgi:hypothetical protein